MAFISAEWARSMRERLQSWLGWARRSKAACVMQLLESLMEDISDNGLSDLSWLAEPEYHNYATRLKEYENPLQSFLQERPYWTRVWTFQGLALAKRGVSLCGTDTLNLNSLRDLAATLNSNRFALFRPPEVNDQIWDLVSPILNFPLLPNVLLYVFREFRDDMKAAATALLSVSSRECTDARDKVYGIMGLFDINIEVDYSLPVAQLYQKTSEAFLQDCRCPEEFFEYAAATVPFSSKHLPSWAADWELKMPQNLLIGDRIPFEARHRIFLPEQRITVVGNAIPTAGIQVDTIAATLRGSTSASWLASCFEFLFQERLDTIFHHILGKPPASDAYVTGGPMVLAVLRTLLGDMDPLVEARLELDEGSGRTADTVVAVVLSLLLMELLRRKSAGRHVPEFDPICAPDVTAGLIVDSARTTTLEFDQIFSILQAFERKDPHFVDMLDKVSCDSTLLFRVPGHPASWQPFRTRDGRIGFARCAAHEGDIVCVLSISKMPVVLRKAGDAYTLVSVCYVHGIMDGELGSDAHKDKFKVENFSIV